MREWEIGAVENIHGALPYIRFAPLLALVGVGVNRIGKELTIEYNYFLKLYDYITNHNGSVLAYPVITHTHYM